MISIFELNSQAKCDRPRFTQSSLPTTLLHQVKTLDISGPPYCVKTSLLVKAPSASTSYRMGTPVASSRLAT